jgi:hypothetical protein
MKQDKKQGLEGTRGDSECDGAGKAADAGPFALIAAMARRAMRLAPAAYCRNDTIIARFIGSTCVLRTTKEKRAQWTDVVA